MEGEEGQGGARRDEEGPRWREEMGEGERGEKKEEVEEISNLQKVGQKSA